MIGISLIFICLFFGLVVMGPFILLLGARLLRIPGIDFRRAFVTNLLVAALGLSVSLIQLIFRIPLVLLFTSLVCLLGAIWIIKRQFSTTILRALGVYLFSIVVAIVLAVSIRTSLFQAYKIPSGAMRPTLLVGDHILVNKFVYGIRLPFVDKTIIPISDPKRGDIVVFKFPEDPEKDFIKRVIGIGGDVVEIRDKKVFLNNQPTDDPHALFLDPHIIPGSARPRDNFGPVKVPPNAVFGMGDNRDHSYDSRFWKFVDLSKVKGKASFIYWSWDSESGQARWDRIGRATGINI